MATTIQDVAKQCGVSTAVVSAALRNAKGSVRFSEDTRLAVLEAAEALNYSPNQLARAMSTGVVPVVALVLHTEDHDASVINTYLHDTLPAAGMQLHKLGFEMLFLPCLDYEEQTRRLGTLISGKLIGGVVSNVIPGTGDALGAFLAKAGIPFVLMGNNLDESVVSVARDASAIMHVLRRYAASRGLESVLQVGMSGSDGTRIPVETDPYTGAERCVDDAELNDPETLIAASGSRVWQFLREKKGVPKERLILDEDARLWVGIRPVLRVHSRQSDRASLAAKLVAQWMKEGTPPCRGRQTLVMDESEIELVEH